MKRYQNFKYKISLISIIFILISLVPNCQAKGISDILLYPIEKIFFLFNPDFPLFLYSDYSIEDIAASPVTTKKQLYKLSKNKSTAVRSAVARNPNAPSKLLAKLSKDKEDSVKLNVALNDNTYVTTLKRLCNDKNSDISQIACKRKADLEETHLQTYKEYWEYQNKSRLFINKNQVLPLINKIEPFAEYKSTKGIKINH